MFGMWNHISSISSWNEIFSWNQYYIISFSHLCTFAKKCWKNISWNCGDITKDLHFWNQDLISQNLFKKLTVEHVSWICLSKSSWQESGICTCEKHSQKIWIRFSLKIWINFQLFIFPEFKMFGCLVNYLLKLL